ncbi:MarR family transcriptional regulator [Streptomyces sp. NPDC020794]|uniref:MarR family transcriptional regulator n=1 Tax=unclassified Streptomyces TaxID=2593676 RepID=UPI0036E8BE5E
MHRARGLAWSTPGPGGACTPGPGVQPPGASCPGHGAASKAHPVAWLRARRRQSSTRLAQSCSRIRRLRLLKSEFYALRAIGEAPPAAVGRRTVIGLADTSGLSQSATSRRVTRLRDRGPATTRVSPHDRRGAAVGRPGVPTTC